MLKYVIILLDKTSVSFCQSDNPYLQKGLMPLTLLKKSIFWAMKENVNIQFIYPSFKLPQEYLVEIDSIDHVDIGPNVQSDVVVMDDFVVSADMTGKNLVIRCNYKEILENRESIIELLKSVDHLSIIIKDVDKMTAGDFCAYTEFLADLTHDVRNMYDEGQTPQLNLLTDRLVLDAMNNCNAGWESITIAPNGNGILLRR